MGGDARRRLRGVLTLAPHLAGAPAATKQAVLALALVVVVPRPSRVDPAARPVVVLLGVATLVLLGGSSSCGAARRSRALPGPRRRIGSACCRAAPRRWAWRLRSPRWW